MPNITHIYPTADKHIAEYVSLLSSDDYSLSDTHIVHVHGCTKEVVDEALEVHARIVFTPHGGLQPWTANESSIASSTTKRLRRLIENSYAVVAHGAFEKQLLETLGWNKRVVEVANPLITARTTPEQMKKEMLKLYKTVANSHPFELITPATRHQMACMLKVGIAQGALWVPKQRYTIDSTQWQHLLTLAHYEGVTHELLYGAQLLDIAPPPFDENAVPIFLPDGYKIPTAKYDLDYIIDNLVKEPCLRHVADLFGILMSPKSTDPELQKAFALHKATPYMQSMMTAMQQFILLDEGFMPIPPKDDKTTQTIIYNIVNHLKL